MKEFIAAVVFIASFMATIFFAVSGSIDRAIFSVLFLLTYLMIIQMMKFNSVIDQMQQLMDRPIVANIDQANWNVLMLAIARAFKRVGLMISFENKRKK